MQLIIAFFISLIMLTAEKEKTTLFDFTVKDIRGNEVSLEQFRGNVILIVNTASKCGFTSQYGDLQKLYDEFRDDGFIVLGFPSANFGGQEFGTNDEIIEFCEMNFQINFPMFSKVDVKGEEQHPLFRYLTSAYNQDFTGNIRWNFEKFLIDKEGNLKRRFRSTTKPASRKIRYAVQELMQ